MPRHLAPDPIGPTTPEPFRSPGDGAPSAVAPASGTALADVPPDQPHAPAAERAPEPTPDDVPAADLVPRDTTPTWELELLVSGAVLFGLFQLAALLDGWMVVRGPHTGMIGTFLVSGGGVLGLTALYTLIACFVVHLALRAYWVALVGAHSVYPGGPRWDRLRNYGPIQTTLLRERVRPLPEFVGRVDNAASVVFASGFVLAVTGLGGLLLLAPAGILFWAVERAFGMDAALVVMGVLVAPFLLLQIVGGTLDYTLKERIDPASRLGRLIRLGLRLALATSPASVRSLSSVLTSNVAPRLVAGALFASGALIAIVGATHLDEGDAVPGRSNYPLFADVGPGTLDAGHYASLRGDREAPRRAPWIDSDVVTGPYVRLHIPYRPIVHDRALAAACPDVRPLAEDAEELETPAARAAVEAVLRCAARLHRVALDGRALDSLRLRFLADARSNRRTFVAHVRVAELPPGEHRLTVWPVRLPDGDHDAPPTPYEIPFWR